MSATQINNDGEDEVEKTALEMTGFSKELFNSPHNTAKEMMLVYANWHLAQTKSLREQNEGLGAIASGVLTCLKYPRGSEAQVRCLEEVGQMVSDNITAKDNQISADKKLVGMLEKQITELREALEGMSELCGNYFDESGLVCARDIEIWAAHLKALNQKGE